MASHPENPRFYDGLSTARFYSPDIQPLLQSALAALADIDFAFEKNLDSIRRSSADEALKREIIDKLKARHSERRAPYVQELAILNEKIEETFR